MIFKSFYNFSGSFLDLYCLKTYYYTVNYPETLKYWVGVQQSQSYLWGKGVSLAFVGHLSSDGIIIKIPCGVDVLLHQPVLHPFFSYCVG